ncbi:MAG: ABC transporter ATP-binding protein [Proteobacteria bacterium]|nr:ABC transporter ATP-binding protein [Pseudomonadota bacterium]
MTGADSDAFDAVISAREIMVRLGGTQILRGASLNVTAGECVGVIGPNGSGKTTFFNTLSGFVPIEGGIISFRGEEITGLQPFERARRGLGRVFQNSGVFREMTVLENMLTAIESREGLWRSVVPWSGRKRQYEQEALRALEEVGLRSHAAARASSLSGGQLRLLEISRTLAVGAEVLLLDEPTAGVAPILKGALASLLRSLKSRGKTVLIIEHDMNFIEQIADRVAVFDLGRVVLEGTVAEVQSSPLLQEIYFGSRIEAPTASVAP